MFAKSSIETKLEKEITSSLDRLDQLDKDSAEYGVVVDRIAKLHKLRADEKPKLPSMDNALLVGANIFGILWLTRYERAGNVISSKALGFVMRPR
jgi:hypothetical protein